MVNAVLPPSQISERASERGKVASRHVRRAESRSLTSAVRWILEEEDEEEEEEEEEEDREEVYWHGVKR